MKTLPGTGPRTIHNVALTDEWAKRFIRDVEKQVRALATTVHAK